MQYVILKHILTHITARGDFFEGELQTPQAPACPRPCEMPSNFFHARRSYW